jgi:hypothetical protein
VGLHRHPGVTLLAIVFALLLLARGFTWLFPDVPQPGWPFLVRGRSIAGGKSARLAVRPNSRETWHEIRLTAPYWRVVLKLLYYCKGLHVFRRSIPAQPAQ